MRIQKNSVVILHVNMLLKDGSAIDSTKTYAKPFMIHMGHKNVSDAFENEIISLEKGDKKKFLLSAKDAFGEINLENIHEFSIHQFENKKKLKVGQIFSFSQMNGSELPGIIKKIDDDIVTINFNHPLAGKDIIFDLEIIDIDPTHHEGIE